MSQTHRTLQDATTSLPPAEVLGLAKRFFALQNGIYTAFIDMEGDNFVSLRGQGGEEIAIGVAESENGTRVTASTYLFDGQVAHFLSTLPPAPQFAPVGNLPESSEVLPDTPVSEGGAE